MIRLCNLFAGDRSVLVIFLICLLPSAIYATELQDLVSTSYDFEVEMIEHAHVLEQNPSASELAASTLKYAKAKERYFLELRKGVPTLIDLATGKKPRTPEIDRLMKIFSGRMCSLFLDWRSSGKAIGRRYGFAAETTRCRRPNFKR
jgi:hypothetical protein